MNTNPSRFWYVSNNRLSIVEKNGLTTVDNASTEYKTISVAKPLRLHTISKADHFKVGANIGSSEYSSSTLGPLGDIPIQFHEALVYKVIAMGYKTPPAMQIDFAQYFDLEYEKVVKQAKKYARSNFTDIGQITPVSF
tara:strand:+ start:103 stop:516 length:414 start_codon:yes stop_codon:yes gene_type:complete